MSRINRPGYWRRLCSQCGVASSECDRNLCPCLERVTPLQVFEWCVVRQSSLGPSITICASALRTTTHEVKAAIAAWNDPRGHMEIVPLVGMRGNRIDAYYNTSGRVYAGNQPKESEHEKTRE